MDADLTIIVNLIPVYVLPTSEFNYYVIGPKWPHSLHVPIHLDSHGGTPDDSSVTRSDLLIVHILHKFWFINTNK